ncbi:hypothetical protein AC1031_012613 [Aphanomyces cochlioides]|nr:hypothetical protein AC1031_012613 [Aphanomyces cochlioides]
MLAPDDVSRSAWRAKDVVRVSLEQRGVIGFIEVGDLTHTTLESVRPLIRENVEDTPQDFQFVLDGGIPLSRRQEAMHVIADHYPCLKIRAMPKKTAKTSKVTVVNASGGEFETWVPMEYTFGQLRKDAARYWDLPLHQTSLVDNDGCVWPDEAVMLSLETEIVEKHIVFTNKALLIPDAGAVEDGHLDDRLHRRRHEKFVETNYEERLWYIFTYYCVHGDALDLLTMTAYQFNRFLKDCRLFHSRVLTPAMGDILYAFEGKGKLSKQSKSKTMPRSSSGKLDYDGFLNALLTIATRLHMQMNPDDALMDILVRYIFPNASSWSMHTWRDHKDALNKPDVVRFIARFSPCLLDIFMFYTNQPEATDNWITFSDCMRFMQDFRFTELLLTTQECPELFLASCHGQSSAVDQTTPLASRETMTFPAFLDLISRAGLVSLTRHRRLDPLQCVKAVFHHMTRSLRGSRALEIMQNHGPVAIYASRFYAGSVAFNNKFLDMWRIEGSPDYVTGGMPTAAPTMTRGRQSIHHIVHSPPSSPDPITTDSAKIYPMPLNDIKPDTLVDSATNDNDGWAVLRRGAVFRKYGTWSSPHRRFVWLNPEGTHLHWRPLSKPEQLNEGFALDSIQTVLSGNVESTRYAFMKYLSQEKYVQRCFSIVAKDMRRLDLEADSETTRDQWVHALHGLLPHTKSN